MPALLYIITSFLLGAGIILSLKPYWQNRLKLFIENGKTAGAPFLFFPASYLVGTLILTWVTYLLANVFNDTGNPLLYANILSIFLAAFFVFIISSCNRNRLQKWFHEFKKYGHQIRFSGMEWFILAASALFWTFFISRSLYMEGDFLHAGVSAFSDFGAHLPVIRSFSAGQNFPAQYPHFPDGTMRYHFMFYFLAGNLEYLGLNLPLALNIPSVLSLVSFNMLLYGLAAGITKKPLAGLLSCVLYSFRSSFAFFTYSGSFTSLNGFFKALANNLDSSGNRREHIGNTLREDWGLWAQKVYINQRHLAFAFGLAILVFFLMLPLFIETVQKWREHPKKLKASDRTKNRKFSFSLFIKSVLTTRDAWSFQDFAPCILAGLLLGLTAFWNGAVVISAISVLFIMAALSGHKLEYLATAVITFILSTLQSRAFVGSGTGAVSIRYRPGFLTESGEISKILSYYVELLGVLPFVILGVFLAGIASKRLRLILSLLLILPLVFFIPSSGPVWNIIITGFCLLLCFTAAFYKPARIEPLSPWLIPVFLGPIVLATTLQLTPDITVNHKYIIFGVILLNIPVSDLLTDLLHAGRKRYLVLGLCLVFMLTATGIVDMITLYNLDKNSVSYNLKDPVKLWAEKETEPGDVFLTHYMTHYGAPMSILLAGRFVYPGYPYFTMTAGYDSGKRDAVMKRIYGSSDGNALRALAISEGIDYIVVEEQNRTTEDYRLNEEILRSTFDVAFEDTARNIVIYSVK